MFGVLVGDSIFEMVEMVAERAPGVLECESEAREDGVAGGYAGADEDADEGVDGAAGVEEGVRARVGKDADVCYEYLEDAGMIDRYLLASETRYNNILLL